MPQKSDSCSHIEARWVDCQALLGRLLLFLWNIIFSLWGVNYTGGEKLCILGFSFPFSLIYFCFLKLIYNSIISLLSFVPTTLYKCIRPPFKFMDSFS